jgi:chorismate dehydratase
LSKLRISIVQYLNTAPLVWGFTNGALRGKYELSFTVPSQCAEDLRNGAADIAIIPAIEYQRIDNLLILPDMAIASKERVRSLLILSKKPMAEVRSIALDRSSRSTQALTKILCDRHWKIAPEFSEMAPDAEAMLEKADAALLIGDPALRFAIEAEADGHRGLHVYDIVAEWHAMTGIPAVLAVWAGRTEVVTDEVVSDFLSSRDLGLRNLREISEQWSKELNLPAKELKTYLKENIDFTLDEENLRGLTAYYAFAAKMRLIPGLKTVAIAGGAGMALRYIDLFFAEKLQKTAI